MRLQITRWGNLAAALSILMFASVAWAQVGLHSDGPLSPAMGQTGQAGTNPFLAEWTSPASVSVSDDARATVTLANQNSVGLTASDFGFALPPDAIIRGFEVRVEIRGIGVSGSTQKSVLLRTGNMPVVFSDAEANLDPFPASDTELVFGGPTMEFDDPPNYPTFSVADVNDPSFGCNFTIESGTPTTSGTFDVDHISMTVYYQLPSELPIMGYAGLFGLIAALSACAVCVLLAMASRNSIRGQR
jgi:hypothetical protein